jgi:hypothetical protein
MARFAEFSGFDWDAGNRPKCRAHGLSIAQIEALFESAIAVLPHSGHSQHEPRFRAIGRESDGRAVFVVFPMRRRGENVLIRPNSARYMHRKEIAIYEKENPDLQNR